MPGAPWPSAGACGIRPDSTGRAARWKPWLCIARYGVPSMRVLHFFKSYYPETFGGCEVAIFKMAEGSRALGIDAMVLSLSCRGAARKEPSCTHFCHRVRKSGLWGQGESVMVDSGG